MLRVDSYVVIKGQKLIKIIKEIEKIDDQIIIYTSDGCSYHISQCETIKEAFNRETNEKDYTTL